MRFEEENGQMTIEFVAVFPAMVAAAFIALQGMAFAGDCATFDIVARDAICRQADDGCQGASGAGELAASIEEALAFDYVDVEVACEKNLAGHVRYEATMLYTPPLLKDVAVFGISAPRFEHRVVLTVSPYRRGVVA